MSKLQRYEPMLLRTNGVIRQTHTHEVRRVANGFVIVTRHYSAESAATEARVSGGEVVKLAR